MKVIDLLNKIANGEEIPEKIKFKNNIYKWIERNDNVFNYKQEYKGRLIDNYLCDDWFMDSESILNDEVEIIEEEPRDIEVCGSWFTKSEYDKLAGIKEEDKKIKKVHDCFISTDNKEIQFLIDNINQLGNKVNEIIDKINEDK